MESSFVYSYLHSTYFQIVWYVHTYSLIDGLTLTPIITHEKLETNRKKTSEKLSLHITMP